MQRPTVMTMEARHPAVRFPKGEAAPLPTEKAAPGRPPQSERPGTAIQCEALSPAHRESGSPRTKDPLYLKFIRRRLCSFCGKPKAVPHHALKRLRGISEAGVAQKGIDYLAIPVCELCHTRIHNKTLRPQPEELLEIIAINVICFLNELRGPRCSHA